MFLPTHCQHIRKPNESYAKGIVVGLNQESGCMVKWDISARSCAIVGCQEKRINRRSNIDIKRGRHKGKSFLKW